MDTLAYKIDSAKIKPIEVQQFCQTISNTKQKMMLATCVFQKVQNPQTTDSLAYWGAILYDLQRFGEYLTFLRTAQHTSFLDIGSANGEKLYAALCLGFQKVYGIEYNPTLANISRKALAAFGDKVEIRWGDAFDVEASFYQKPDILYLYSPIKDAYKMAKLYALLMQNMKNGAILLEMRMVYSQALREVIQLDFPEMTGFFALKKEANAFYYLTYTAQEKHWIKLVSKQ